MWQVLIGRTHLSLIDKAMNSPVGSSQECPLNDMISNEYMCMYVPAQLHIGKEP
jgi:hypothetical protein